jgi:predicted acyl esterase
LPRTRCSIVRDLSQTGQSPGPDRRLPEDPQRITVDLWPTAHRFAAGHRIRLQVSSGAHPRYARNPGSGEPLATATTLLAQQQSVHHDPPRPSAILLPVTGY